VGQGRKKRPGKKKVGYLRVVFSNPPPQETPENATKEPRKFRPLVGFWIFLGELMSQELIRGIFLVYPLPDRRETRNTRNRDKK
jgi:hypothetical protein